jgi:hypothetical protein
VATHSINGPLEDVKNGGADFATAEIAKHQKFEALLLSCMNDKGFEYWAKPADIDLITRTGLEMAYRTDLADENRRKSVGYGATAYLVGKASAYEGKDTTAAKAEAAYEEALQACGPQSFDTLFPTELIDEVSQLGYDTEMTIRFDDEVVASEKNWSKCMAQAGYAFKTFEEPSLAVESKGRGLPLLSKQARELHKKELQMAQDDWDCRVKYVNDVWFRVRDREELKFIEQNQEVVGKLRDAMREVVYGE